MQRMWALAIVAAFVTGCGGETTCRTDGDCQPGYACASSGGVVFGQRVCVAPVPLDPADAADAAAADAGGNTVADDMEQTDVPAEPDTSDVSDMSTVDSGPCEAASICARNDAECGAIEVEGECAGGYDCGRCDETTSCFDNRCVDCVPESTDELCAANDAACGELQVTDRCGEMQTVDCGGCSDGRPCGSTIPNQCSCDLETLCEARDQVCGSLDISTCPELAGATCGDCGMGSCADGSCECASGYAPSPDTGHCVDIDECAIATSCPDGAICTNVPGAWSCECDQTQRWYGDGATCYQSPILDPGDVWVNDGYIGGTAFDIPNVDFVPGALYVVVIALGQGQVSQVNGLGATWTLLDRQCGEGGEVEVWTTDNAATSSDIDFTISGGQLGNTVVAVATAWQGARVGLIPPVGHNSDGSPANDCGGGRNTISYSVAPTHESAIVLAGAGSLDATSWSLGTVEAETQTTTFRDHFVYLVSWGPPAAMPQRVSADFGEDNWAAITFEILPFDYP